MKRWDSLTEQERDAVLAEALGWHDIREGVPPIRHRGSPPLSDEDQPIPCFQCTWSGFGMLMAYAERAGWTVMTETGEGCSALVKRVASDGATARFGGLTSAASTLPLALARAMWQALGLEET